MKKFLFREPILPLQRTLFDWIEYYWYKFMPSRLISIKLLLKWHKTFVREGLERIDLSTDKIKIIKSRQKNN